MGGVHSMVRLVLFEQLDSVLDRLRLIIINLFTINNNICLLNSIKVYLVLD